VGALVEPVGEVGVLAGAVEGVGAVLVAFVAGGVDGEEVGADVVFEPVVDDVEGALVGCAPGAGDGGGGVAGAGVEADQHHVGAADLDVGAGVFDGAVDAVVQVGVALVVPAVLLVVPEALQLVPDHDPLDLGVAGDGFGGQAGEVVEVFRQRGFFELVPVGLAFLAAFHPVRGAAEGEHGALSGLFGQAHALVEGVPVVLAGFGFGVAGAEPHQVVV